jgi:ATP adenylyltransferase
VESGKQNAEEPFKPPYVEELYVGTLDGIEGEEGMSILVSPIAHIEYLIIQRR